MCFELAGLTAVLNSHRYRLSSHRASSAAIYRASALVAPSRTALSCNSTHFLPLLAKLGTLRKKKKGKAGIRFPLVDGAQDGSPASGHPS